MTTTHRKTKEALEKLEMAIILNDEGELKKLLQQGCPANISMQLPDKKAFTTPLKMAIVWAAPGLIDILLKHKADPFYQAPETKCYTPCLNCITIRSTDEQKAYFWRFIDSLKDERFSKLVTKEGATTKELLGHETYTKTIQPLLEAHTLYTQSLKTAENKKLGTLARAKGHQQAGEILLREVVGSFPSMDASKSYKPKYFKLAVEHYKNALTHFLQVNWKKTTQSEREACSSFLYQLYGTLCQSDDKGIEAYERLIFQIKQAIRNKTHVDSLPATALDLERSPLLMGARQSEKAIALDDIHLGGLRRRQTHHDKSEEVDTPISFSPS